MSVHYNHQSNGTAFYDQSARARRRASSLLFLEKKNAVIACVRNEQI